MDIEKVRNEWTRNGTRKKKDGNSGANESKITQSNGESDHFISN